MSKIYTIREYERAIEDREQVQEKIECNAPAAPDDQRPLVRELEKIEAAIAAFAICAGKPAVSKGKPEYSWKRARRRNIRLDKT